MFASSSRRPGAGSRFSLLLLEEGEFYVRDFVATAAWPPDVPGNALAAPSLPGQLRLCTRSLFFEPDDVRVPIVRLPFEHLEQLEGIGRAGVAVVARRLQRMKANAADEPYAFEKDRASSWSFTLTYAALADFMPLAQRALVASRLPSADRDALLNQVLAEVEGALRFDLGHLRNPSTETVALEAAALRLAPLVQEPCRLALTPARLYMQLLHNVSGGAAVRSHPLECVAAVARRRSGLKDVGLEVFFTEPTAEAGVAPGPTWGSPSAFFAFQSTEERERVVQALTAQRALGASLPGGRAAAAAAAAVLEAGGGWLPRVTAAWQHGRISNFQYILFCNLAAGRSFNDLTQYPVFPWILADYTAPNLDLSNPDVFRDLSRPVGALNPARLAQFRARYEAMAEMASVDPDHAEPPFMYGTHYSCPGYTMFWLVRATPAHMLRLQGGRFDAPDRLFSSVPEAWESVLSNPADVKEFIPEFYMPGRPEFLVNSRRLALGIRQDGRAVGDVELPPWAAGSPERFLAMQAAALEAPFVSANLHHWLDLIFGAKQRGPAAAAADNVFRHLTYEGAIDPATIDDPVQRAAAETAINEFGQCPRQIFKHPHPPRLVCPPPPPVDELMQTAGSGGVLGTSTAVLKPSSTVSGGDRAPPSQSLSLALVSAIVATLEDGQAPAQAMEVPAELRELDVLAKRAREEAAAPQKQQQQATSPSPATTAAGAGAAGGSEQRSSSPGSADPPAPPFASAKAGLVGRWNVLKGALQEAGSGSGRDGGVPLNSASGSAGSGPLSRLAGSLSSRWASAHSGSRKSGEVPAPAAPPAAPTDGESGAVDALNSAADERFTFQSEPECPQSPELPHPADDAASPSLPPAPALLWKTATSPASRRPASGDPEDCGGVWGPGLRDRLRPGATFVAGAEGINSLELYFAAAAPCVYSAGHDGSVRVYNAESGVQIRAVRLGAGQPLTSLALLPPSPARALQTHPTVLCGSYDGNVYAYNPSAGRVVGSFAPHADAVACVALAGPSALATASWDCSVKLWDLEEGRQPWDSTLPLPTAAVDDLPGGVWAMAADPSGSVLVGTEEGYAVYFDLRAPPGAQEVWQQQLSDDYVGGVALVPGGAHALVACANGTLSLLDCRRGGEEVSSVACSTPLRCCATDGELAAAGGESGALLLWDVAQQLERAPVAGAKYTPPGLDGLYAPLTAEPASPVTALAVAPALQRGTSGGSAALCLATGHEGGLVRVYWADPQA